MSQLLVCATVCGGVHNVCGGSCPPPFFCPFCFLETSCAYSPLSYDECVWWHERCLWWGMPHHTTCPTTLCGGAWPTTPHVPPHTYLSCYHTQTSRPTTQVCVVGHAPPHAPPQTPLAPPHIQLSSHHTVLCGEACPTTCPTTHTPLVPPHTPLGPPRVCVVGHAPSHTPPPSTHVPPHTLFIRREGNSISFFFPRH